MVDRNINKPDGKPFNDVLATARQYIADTFDSALKATEFEEAKGINGYGADIIWMDESTEEKILSTTPTSHNSHRWLNTI